MINIFRKKRGVATLLFVLSLPLIAALMTLIINFSFLVWKQRELQNIADAAAYQSAIAYENGSTTQSGLFTAALNSASNNSWARNTTNTMDVSSPPNAGSEAGKSNYIRVVMTEYQPTFLIALFSSKPNILTATSTVLVGESSSTKTVPGNGCVLVVNQNSEDLSFQNNAGIYNSSCDIVNDSTSSNATYLNNNAVIQGTLQEIGGNQLQNNSSIGTIKKITTPVADPYPTNLTAADAGSCVSSQPINLNNNAEVVLPPGNYCHGISASNNDKITLSPGIFYFGGEFNVQNNVTLTGNGVTIVFSTSMGNVNLQNNAKFNLSPPTSGPTAGEVITYYNPNGSSSSLVGTSTQYINIGNNLRLNYTGVINLPDANVQFQNNGEIGTYADNSCNQIIANELILSNNVSLGSNCTDIPGVQTFGSTSVNGGVKYNISFVNN